MNVFNGRRPGVNLALGIGAAIGVRELVRRQREESLGGKVALITGGSRGLGLAIARELASQGCAVALCARDAGEVARAQEEIRALGVDAEGYACDVTDRVAVEEMVAYVIGRFGRIDLLFTVAGIIEVAELQVLGFEDFERAMDTMFWGTLTPILAVLPQMRARHAGQIATVTSIGGRIAVPHLLSYSAAKFATVGLSTGLAAELQRDGIAVTTVVPGLMRTGSHLAAQFKGEPGQQVADYTWFSLGASTLLVPRADRAARIIVRSVRRRDPLCTFSWPFVLANRVAGLAPAMTVRAMQLANRLLPHSTDGTPSSGIRPGVEIAPLVSSRFYNRVTAPGRDAASDFNQDQA